MPQVERAGRALVDRLAQDRLEMMLRHVDDERIAGIVAEQRGLNRWARGIGGALDVADLVHAQCLDQHLIGHAVAAERLDRPGEDRSRLGVARELRVVLEQQEWQPIENEPERGRQPDRLRSDHDDRLHRHGCWSCAGKAKSRLMIDAVMVAASDNRNMSAPTASSGCPTPTEARQRASSAPALAARYCGVSITPGAIRLKRTRCGAISLAALLTKAISAALLAA